MPKRRLFKVRIGRGFLTVVAWVVWPIVALFIDFIYRFLSSNSRRCSIEGCDWDSGIWDALLVFGPPIYLTIRWWRSRHRRDNSGAHDSRP
ncbi:MAG TPA: hypothetical protein VF929_06855 [Gemmatimonadaceae bacterium]